MKNEEGWNHIQRKIEQSKNINDLPLIKNLITECGDSLEIAEEWDGKIIKILDGTKVKLLTDIGLRCFNDKNDCNYYYIDEIDTYICAECGLWQKEYSDIKKQVGYEEDFENKLLPDDWNKKRIRIYLGKGANIQKKKQAEYDERIKKENEEFTD